MWITKPDRASRTGISHGRRQLLGGGLTLLTLTWLCGPGSAVISVRKAAAVTAIGDDFVEINGWVLPASYFRD